MALEISATSQPNSFDSGMMSAPGSPMAPAVVSVVDEGHRDDHPSVMDAVPRQPFRQGPCQHVVRSALPGSRPLARGLVEGILMMYVIIQ